MKSYVIRRGAVLDRGVKTSGDLALGMDARVRGGAIALGDLSLSTNSVVEGRVSVEGDLVMGPGSRVGGDVEVKGTARLLPGSEARRIVAGEVEARRSEVEEVVSRGDILLVESQVDRLEAGGRVVARR